MFAYCIAYIGITVFPLIDQKIYVACYYWFPMSFLILLFAIFNKNGGGLRIC